MQRTFNITQTKETANTIIYLAECRDSDDRLLSRFELKRFKDIGLVISDIKSLEPGNGHASALIDFTTAHLCDLVIDPFEHMVVAKSNETAQRLRKPYLRNKYSEVRNGIFVRRYNQ